MDARFAFVGAPMGAGGLKVADARTGTQVRRRQTIVASAADRVVLSRRAALRTAAALGALGLLKTDSGIPGTTLQALAEEAAEITYETTKTGWEDGPTPKVGDMVGIRFKATFNGKQIDNTFGNPSPYYFRLGNGNVVKGLEQAVGRMRIGETAHVVVPGPLAFGKEGRRAGPGRPSIPPYATIVYDVELAEYPGYERELIELNEEDETEMVESAEPAAPEEPTQAVEAQQYEEYEEYEEYEPEPTQTVETAEPVEKVQVPEPAGEVVENVQSSEPVSVPEPSSEPITVVEPTEPMTSQELVENIEKIEMVEPGKGAQLVELVEKLEAGEAIEPAKAVELVDLVEKMEAMDVIEAETAAGIVELVDTMDMIETIKIPLGGIQILIE